MLLVLSFDGKGIVMLPGALRQATARAASAAGKKLATRLSPGEKNGRKRMAELGAVYDAVPQVRSPADIIACPGQGADARRRRGPAATGKWLTASVTADISEVIAAGFDEAERRDPHHQRTWAVLVDGNRTQIDAITAEAANRRQVSVHIVCDFIHVLEYLWKAAWSFFEPGDRRRRGAGSLTRPARSWTARPPRSPQASAAAPPPTATPPPSAPAPTPARATSPPRRHTSAMTPH